MAQHHGVGFPGFPHPVFPSMDAMANAPFDNVINHLNTVTHQLAHVHHQMHQQMHHFHHNNVPQPLPPPQFHNVHNLNQFHRDMMTHNMRIHQAMQDMSRVQTAMVEVMNHNMVALHTMHPMNYARIQGPVHMHMHMHGHPLHHHHPHRHHHHDYEAMLRLDESIKKKGVTEVDLSKLKRVKFSAKETCKQCGICQENFTTGTQVIMLPCKHIYCEEEILTWFDQHKTCPTCRHVVENVDAY